MSQRARRARREAPRPARADAPQLPAEDRDRRQRDRGRAEGLPAAARLRVRGAVRVRRPELRVRLAVLRRLHRVLLHDDRQERLPAGHDRGGLVEGRRLAVLQRPPLLHRLQRDVPLRWRALLPRQLLELAVGLRLRQGRLQQPQGRLHRSSATASATSRSATVGRIACRVVSCDPARARVGQLRADARGRQLDREPQQALPAGTTATEGGDDEMFRVIKGDQEQHALAHATGSRSASIRSTRPRSTRSSRPGVTNGARRRSIWPQAWVDNIPISAMTRSPEQAAGGRQ